MRFISIFTECAGLGTPLSLAALAGVSPALPQGGGKRTCVSPGALGGEAKQREKFASPQGFPLSTGITWLPPMGELAQGAPAPCD